MSKKNPRDHRKQDEFVSIVGDQGLVVPEDLLLNTSENAAEDARVWSLVSKYSKQDGEMPTQSEIAELLDRSLPTVNKTLQMLRINRWLTVINDGERDSESGQFKRLAYALHTDQVPIKTIMDLDPGYKQFLQEKIDGQNRALIRRAKVVMEELNRYLLGDNEEGDHSVPARANNIEEAPPPTKIFLNGLEVPTTSTSSTTITNTPKSSTTNILDIGQTVKGLYSSDTNDSRDIPSSNPNTTMSSPSNILDISQTVKGLYTPDVELPCPDPELEKPPEIDLSPYFKALPQSIHRHMIREMQTHQLAPDMLAVLLKVVVKRMSNTELKPVQHLPAFVSQLFRKAASGELYDSEAAKQDTREKRNKVAADNQHRALVVRGRANGVEREDGEQLEEFEKRVANAEWRAQMKRYGVDIDPRTGLPIETNNTDPGESHS